MLSHSVTNLVSGTRLQVSLNTKRSGTRSHSLKVLEALVVRPLLADLLGELDQGSVALLPQPSVAPRDDLLPVLGHGHRLQQDTRQLVLMGTISWSEI